MTTSTQYPVLETLPAHLRLDTIGGTICCERCGDDSRRELFYVETIRREAFGPEEMLAEIYEACGFDDEGNCPLCSKSAAQEDAADRAMRDRKADMEGVA